MTQGGRPAVPGAHGHATGSSFSATAADLQAALDARRELGPEYERDLIAGFVERLDETIDARVRSQVAERRRDRPGRMSGGQLALGIVTVSLGLPLSGITTQFGPYSFVAFLAVWVGIAVVNMAAAVSRRR